MRRSTTSGSQAHPQIPEREWFYYYYQSSYFGIPLRPSSLIRSAGWLLFYSILHNPLGPLHPSFAMLIYVTQGGLCRCILKSGANHALIVHRLIGHRTIVQWRCRGDWPRITRHRFLMVVLYWGAHTRLHFGGGGALDGWLTELIQS